jgi:kumamolisin
MHPYVVKADSTTWTDQQLAVARGGGRKNLPGGSRVAILELSGGWIQADNDAFADASGIPHFTVADVSTDGVVNNSNDASQDASVEVALDVQRVVGRYFAETGKIPSVTVLWGTDISTVTQYFADHSDQYDILSISWGAPESEWSQADQAAYSKASAQAVAQGQVITAASGDNGPGDGLRGLHTDLPSSDPNTVACGGTTKSLTESLWGTKANDGPGEGAGYSALFTKPPWQTTSGTMRSVPDILEVADPATGYVVYVNGSTQVVGGTSASAPAVAGYLAALGGKLYDFLPTIWANPGAFTEVTLGVDGKYVGSDTPGPGNGLGVVNYSALAGLKFTIGPPPAPVPPTQPRLFPRLTGWLQSILAWIEGR